MKKILILIHDMRIGGAQRSLLSFLNCLCAGQTGLQYHIDLMVIDPVGPFYSQIPEQVHILPPPAELRWLGTSLNKELLCKHFTWNSFFGELTWLLKKRENRELNLQQRLWKSWNKRIPRLQTEYDVAIAYMDGVPNYYVMEKVTAQKKVLWIHSQYQKQGYNRDFDRAFFDAAQKIVTISDQCKASILEDFPEFSEKISILENITNPEEVEERSKASCLEFSNTKKLKLLTVARLNYQKGVDLAVSAAGILKREEIPFLWLVAGDGPERSRLQADIENLGLQEEFCLLGGVDNPYAYMAACDILVQPSRVEGKSIVLDEAKILCKPIIATNYATVTDSLNHGENGFVVEMTPEGIADGIKSLWQNDELRQKMVKNLQIAPKGNLEQLQKYIEVMF